MMAEDETDGVPPDRRGRRRPTGPRGPATSRRVSVGKIDERIGIMAKRLLPYRLFEQAAKGSLGV